jgi:hypothetical protein
MSHGMDIGAADAITAREDEGQAVHIKDYPSGEPAFDGDQPVMVRIAGSYSKLYRKTQDAQTQRMIKRRQSSLTAEQLAQNRIDLVAACILGWEGFHSGRDAFPHTRENAALLLTKAPWILDQLWEAQQNHEGFSPGSSLTS